LRVSGNFELSTANRFECLDSLTDLYFCDERPRVNCRVDSHSLLDCSVAKHFKLVCDSKVVYGVSTGVSFDDSIFSEDVLLEQSED
jgi:hypothetical protein